MNRNEKTKGRAVHVDRVAPNLSQQRLEQMEQLAHILACIYVELESNTSPVESGSMSLGQYAA